MELNGKETWINSDRRYWVFDLGCFAQYSQNPLNSYKRALYCKILRGTQKIKRRNYEKVV